MPQLRAIDAHALDPRHRAAVAALGDAQPVHRQARDAGEPLVELLGRVVERNGRFFGEVRDGGAWGGQGGVLALVSTRAELGRRTDHAAGSRG